MIEELNELRKENKSLRSQVSVLEQSLGQYQADGSDAFVHELNRWIVNATAYIKLKSGNISELVTGENKDFDRIMKLIEATKEHVKDRQVLISLGITGAKAKEKEDERPIIETMAETRK